ncbi:putative MFS-type transporter [Paramyrothecium foliicola]|nr:putative MFS-type transporter [Paramyrothecium foliicola]
MAASPPSTPSAEPTDTSVESQRHSTHVSHFRLLWDQPCITPEILNHSYRGDGTSESPFLVEFVPNDPRNAMSWPQHRKWAILGTMATATLAVSFTASAYAGIALHVLLEFGVSPTAVISGVSLYVLGFALAPLVWAPLSELYGRQRVFFITYMALTAFNAGATGATNMVTLAALRFCSGAFGSTIMPSTGGAIADMFPSSERGIAANVFSAAPFLAPALGPIAGGFLGEAAGWRWVQGLTAIFTGVLWFTAVLVCPETYAPVLLRRRAEALSRQTGRVYVSKLDAGQAAARSLPAQISLALARPWKLLFREPIVILLSIYAAIVYGTLFMSFAAYPIVFQQNRGWGPGTGGLAFGGILVGMTIGVAGGILDNRRYLRVVARTKGRAPPEARLPPAMVGAILVPVGQFWFAWTNGKEVHWIVPIIGTSVFACGVVQMIVPITNYLIDSYVMYAASVLAADAILHSLFGAAFPLFTSKMYSNLGIHWASSVPAFLAIRIKCKYAGEAARVLESMRAMQHETKDED